MHLSPLNISQQQTHPSMDISSAKQAIHLLQSLDDNDAVLPTLTRTVLDSKYILSYKEFTTRIFNLEDSIKFAFSEGFHSFFRDAYDNSLLPSNKVQRIRKTAKNRIRTIFSWSTLIERFQKENQELYQKIVSSISEKIIDNDQAQESSLVHDLHRAYAIMLAYPEVKSNWELFQ